MFETRTLIYHDGHWYELGQCVWHDIAGIGSYVPIKASYPELEELFFEVLQVHPVTDCFLLEELAKAAAKPNDGIRKLMLSVGMLLSDDIHIEELEIQVKLLRTTSFLPCSTPTGERKFLSPNDSFFIVDNDRYAEAFRD